MLEICIREKKKKAAEKETGEKVQREEGAKVTEATSAK